MNEFEQNDQMEIKPTVTESEAIALALEALEEAAGKFHFDVRMAEIMGESVPRQARLGVIKRAQYLEAKKVLQGMRWWNDTAPSARPNMKAA